MTEPRWLSFVHILAIHSDQIQAHGGSLGLRDRGLLESALDRPRNRFGYEPDADLATLAAAYGYWLSSNHPFVDGNKRVAFQAMYLFLGLNGFRNNSLWRPSSSGTLPRSVLMVSEGERRARRPTW